MGKDGSELLLSAVCVCLLADTSSFLWPRSPSARGLLLLFLFLLLPLTLYWDSVWFDVPFRIMAGSVFSPRRRFFTRCTLYVANSLTFQKPLKAYSTASAGFPRFIFRKPTKKGPFRGTFVRNPDSARVFDPRHFSGSGVSRLLRNIFVDIRKTIETARYRLGGVPNDNALSLSLICIFPTYFDDQQKWSFFAVFSFGNPSSTRVLESHL